MTKIITPERAQFRRLAGRPVRRAVAIAATIATALVASAGSASAYNWSTDKPTDLHTRVVLSESHSTAYYCTDLWSRGLHHEQTAPAGQVIVGYDNDWYPGTDPFPCWQKIDHAFRGYVRFDVSKLAGGNFTDAYLAFYHQASTRQTHIAYERGVRWSALSRVGALTSTFSPGAEDGAHSQGGAFHPAVFLAGKFPAGRDPNYSKPNGIIVNGTHWIRVTDLVRAWTCGVRRNHGFVLRGPNETYGENNWHLLTWFGNFQLHVRGVNERTRVGCPSR